MSPTGLGLFDTLDGCWLGDNDGPAIFVDADLANVARSVAVIRLEWPGSRIEVRPFAETANKKRDEIETKLTTSEALTWLEDNWPMRRRASPQEERAE